GETRTGETRTGETRTGETRTRERGKAETGPTVAVPLAEHAPLYRRPRPIVGQAVWAPRQQVSVYPRTDPYLEREVEAILSALDEYSPQSPLQLSRSVGARFWGPGRFGAAVRSGLASGLIRRPGRDRLASKDRQ
ncbi:MAG TPA: hypothetical protein VEJ84_01975, partial [Acidimicrobiales bacterium]|nr:hypothetical protein [Acidimicrobiales bacterium]